MGVQTQANRPQPAINSDFTFIGGKNLFVGDGWLPGPDNIASRVDQFYALDLSVAWTSDTPAWTRLARRANVPGNVITAGTMAATKDSTTILFFDALSVHRYNIKTNDWTSSQNATLVNGFHAGATTDTDTGLVYGVSAAEHHRSSVVRPARVTEFNPATNTYTVQEYAGFPHMAMGGSTVYSSATKASTCTSRPATMHFSAYGGKKLILAGGQTERGSDEVYVFDVTTAEWTKTSSIPLGYYTATCAVSGDSFILWGGGHGAIVNDGGPIVLDIPSGKWGTKFTSVGTQSAADRGSRALPVAFSAMVRKMLMVRGWWVEKRQGMEGGVEWSGVDQRKGKGLARLLLAPGDVRSGTGGSGPSEGPPIAPAGFVQSRSGGPSIF
ncbi:hypothetical protein BGZ75_002604 [Mortierella antarctica]|nr:hypothetical protein BGZ75_002604 [Mortierella antarctica]